MESSALIMCKREAYVLVAGGRREETTDAAVVTTGAQVALVGGYTLTLRKRNK